MSKLADLYQQFFSGTMEEKLDMAEQLYGKYGVRLLAEKEIREQLENVQDLALQNHKQMQNMTMDVICTRCAAGDGGGCCSRYMANENDVLQLLMNMLAGVEVKFQRDDHECCFLGQRGCILTLKPMFCLNYNCGKILEHETVDNLLGLEKCTGSLLTAQNKLEGMLVEFFMKPPKKI